MTNTPALPPGWVWTKLGEISDLFGGGTPSRQKSEYFSGDIIWLTPTEIPKENVRVISESKEKITELGLRKSSARLLPKDTVLMTSRASIGYVAIAGAEVTTNQGFASFVCRPGIYNYYLAYWLKANVDLFLQQATGTTFKEISKAKLRPLVLPLPPLAEQQRIVDAIETQFTRLEAGVAALKQAQAKLKRYRAAVLKAACEGSLVPQDPADEPATELLARILEERRAKWNGRGKYKDPTPPDTANLPPLPVGWVWASLEMVADAVDPQPSHRTPPQVENGVPYVSIGDVKNGKLVLEKTRKVSKQVLEEHKKRYSLRDGDFIFGKIGTLGRPVKLPQPFNYTLSANIVLIQPKYKYIYPDLLFFYLASPIIENLLAKKRRATTQAAFGITRVRVLPVPLPPLAEQRRIVAEVERRLSVVSEVEAAVEANLKRAARLRQAILKRAFEGKLVPQNPHDEPASALLARIRAARAKETPPKKRRSKK